MLDLNTVTKVPFHALENLEENHFPTNFINDFYTMYM